MNASSITLRVLRLKHGLDLPLPAPASLESAGLDLRAAVAATVVIEPLSRVLIPSGIAMEIPSGWEGQVRPRSGLAINHGITVTNSPGTIDSDYRGEVKVGLINLGDVGFEVKRGDRIAQLVLGRSTQVVVEEVDRLTDSERGEGGFGSTGLT
jgi:dUTP pyrophosphatase